MNALLSRTWTNVVIWLAILVALFSPISGFCDELAPESKPVSSRDLPLVESFQETSPQVEVVADNLEYDKDDKKIIAKKNVVVTYQDIKITSDYAEVQTESKEALVKGHVLIFRGTILAAEGDEVFFNFESQSGSFPDGRHFDPPWFVMGEDIRQLRKGVTVIQNAHVTTCNLEEPHYEIQASRVTVYSGDKLVAHRVKLVILGKPVFWWPYLTIPLGLESLPFSVSAGHNNEDGYYIEATKGVRLTPHANGKILADWRSNRGFGSGGIVDYDFGRAAQGDFVGYITQDDNAPTIGEDNPYSKRDNRSRWRMSWRNRADLDPYSFMLLRFHRASDEFVLQDFFEKEYRAEVEQQSFITLTKNSHRYGALVHVQKRLNDFEAMVERLPEVRFDWKNQPLFWPGLYYVSQSSVANLHKVLGRSQSEQDVVRFDSVHEWARPLKWRELKLTPFSSLRGTYYSRDRRDADKKFRTALGYGADLRTHFYKTYTMSADNLGIEINNLRHVLEPSIRLESIHPSTVSDENLEGFDPIDAVDDQDVITFGLENRIQTKRVIQGRMQRVDIVSLNTFLNYAVHPDDRTSRSNFKILSQEIILRPYQWLQYETRFKYDIEDGQMQAFNQDMIIRRGRWRFLLGHRYIKDSRPNFNSDALDTSHQFVFENSWKLNRLWALHGHVRWDADRHELEEWQIGATRDLHDFILDFGYNVRSSSIRSSNRELYFNFTMKQFPLLALRSGSGRASFSPPRIGETVAGANQNVSTQTNFFEQGINTY